MLGDCGKIGTSYTDDGNVKWCSQFRNQSNGFFKKLNINLPYNSAIPLVGTNPSEMKHTSTQRLVHKDL